VSEIPPAATVMDDQVSLALARVHGRLRRRRNRLRGAGAVALACVALLGVGVANRPQGPEADARFGIDAMEPGGPATDSAVPDQDGICGRILPSAEGVGLELTIQEPVEWPVLGANLGAPQQVTVIARNAGTRSLTISSPAGVVGLSDDVLVDTELAAPVLMATTVTLEPTQVVELPAGLPYRSCDGEALDDGTYTIAPIVLVWDDRHPPVAVRGSSLAVQHR
jgi:hypothetical protein